MGNLVEVTVGEEGERALIDWCPPKKKHSRRSEYRRRGVGRRTLSRINKTGKRVPAQDKELTAGACAPFAELLLGDKLPGVVWEAEQKTFSSLSMTTSNTTMTTATAVTATRRIRCNIINSTWSYCRPRDRKYLMLTASRQGGGEKDGGVDDGSATFRAAGGRMEASASVVPLNQGNSAGGRLMNRGREVPLTLAYSRSRRGTQGSKKGQLCVVCDMSTSRCLRDGVRKEYDMTFCVL